MILFSHNTKQISRENIKRFLIEKEKKKLVWKLSVLFVGGCICRYLTMKCCMLAIISTPLDIYYFKILINNIMKLVSIFASVKGGLQKWKAVDGWNCCL